MRVRASAALLLRKPSPGCEGEPAPALKFTSHFQTRQSARLGVPVSTLLGVEFVLSALRREPVPGLLSCDQGQWRGDSLVWCPRAVRRWPAIPRAGGEEEPGRYLLEKVVYKPNRLLPHPKQQ